jgi:hypothetical protein
MEKGLIRESDIDLAATVDGRWGPRLEKLLNDGRLDEIAVAALAEELGELRDEAVADTLDSERKRSPIS